MEFHALGAKMIQGTTFVAQGTTLLMIMLMQ